MLSQLNTLLTSAIRADPLCCLANAVCWLDPLWRSDGDDDGDGDPLATGLWVTREAFPDAYAGAVERIRAGMSDREIDRYLCTEISQQGIPVDDLESLGYGIPLPAYGVRLDDPHFHEAHPDVLSILALFGTDADADTPEGDFSERVGKLLHERLCDQDDLSWKQVGWALGWLFSCTGNSSVDYDWEDLSEFQPLSWEADQIAFARELIEETEAIMADVAAGLSLLARPAVQTALRCHIERAYRHVEKGKADDRHFRLDWRAALVGTDGATEPPAGVLLVRSDAA